MITADMVSRIVGFKGDGLPVLSMYTQVPIDARIRTWSLLSHVDSQLHELRPTGEDSTLGHDAMMSIRGDIERIQDEAQEKRWAPGAVAFFSCSGRGFFEAVQLPRSVRDRLMVDENPWVRPMLAVLDEYHRSCVAVVDREIARIFELFQGEMRETARIRRSRDPVTRSGDPDKKDQKLDELSKQHFRQVVSTLDQQYRNGGFELLIVGGYQPEVPRFLDQLTHELRPLVAGTFPIDEHTKASPAEIKQQATAIVARYERDEEQRMVAEVMEKVAAHGLGALGLRQCLWAGSVAAVDCLLVEDGVIEPGVVCDQDRWLGLGGQTCPICGRPTRSVPDVVDELCETVIENGGKVEHVTADTPLRDHVLGAYLRFPLPDPPEQLA